MSKPQVEKMKPARDVRAIHRQVRLSESGARKKAKRDCERRKRRARAWAGR